MFQESFKGISMKVWGGGGFLGHFKSVLRKFHRCFEEVKRTFQRSYLDVFISPKR